MSEFSVAEAVVVGVPSLDLSSVRTAEECSDYSLLELQHNGQRFAAVPALLREGGILVAVPEEAFPEEELVLAFEEGFPGVVGPYVSGSCTLRGARRAELHTAVDVLIVDLDTSLLHDPTGSTTLVPCTEDGLRDLPGFGLVQGRSLWPSAEGVRRLVGVFRNLATPEPLHHRSLPYATADEEGAAGSGGPSRSPRAVSTPCPNGAGADDRLEALEAQVQALAATLEARSGARPGSSTVIEAGTAVPPLFEAEAGRAGFSREQLTALLRAAGRPPDRLNDDRLPATVGANAPPSARAPGPSSPPLALPKSSAAGSWGASPSVSPGSPAASELLGALVQQNNSLLSALVKPRSDQGGDLLDPEGCLSTGMRGYQARQQFQASVKQDPGAVYGSVRRRLAAAVGVDEETLPSAAMRTFFTNKVPLGSMKGLTHFCFAVAQLWEAAERDDVGAMKAQIALLAVYLEQVAVDGGRHQLGWLLTGLPDPPFRLVQAHTPKARDDPVGYLGDPGWVAANLAYLRDVDFLDQRTRAAAMAPAVVCPPGRAEAPLAKAKGSPKAAETLIAGGLSDSR